MALHVYQDGEIMAADELNGNFNELNNKINSVGGGYLEVNKDSGALFQACGYQKLTVPKTIFTRAAGNGVYKATFRVPFPNTPANGYEYIYQLVGVRNAASRMDTNLDVWLSPLFSANNATFVTLFALSATRAVSTDFEIILRWELIQSQLIRSANFNTSYDSNSM